MASIGIEYKIDHHKLLLEATTIRSLGGQSFWERLSREYEPRGDKERARREKRQEKVSHAVHAKCKWRDEECPPLSQIGMSIQSVRCTMVYQHI